MGDSVHPQSAPAFFAPSHLVCPDCGGPMCVLAIAPVPFENRADEITYRCDGCGTELKRVTKPLDD
jgi:hypothetical protein